MYLQTRDNNNRMHSWLGVEQCWVCVTSMNERRWDVGDLRCFFSFGQSEDTIAYFSNVPRSILGLGTVWQVQVQVSNALQICQMSPLHHIDRKTMASGTHTHPSPEMAQHGCICHLCFLMAVRLSSFDICATVRHPLMSCLLAYTSTAALRKSSCANIRHNSSRLTLIRSRSLLSITMMIN